MRFRNSIGPLLTVALALNGSEGISAPEKEKLPGIEEESMQRVTDLLAEIEAEIITTLIPDSIIDDFVERFARFYKGPHRGEMMEFVMLCLQNAFLYQSVCLSFGNVERCADALEAVEEGGRDAAGKFGVSERALPLWEQVKSRIMTRVHEYFAEPEHLLNFYWEKRELLKKALIQYFTAETAYELSEKLAEERLDRSFNIVLRPNFQGLYRRYQVDEEAWNQATKTFSASEKSWQKLRMMLALDYEITFDDPEDVELLRRYRHYGETERALKDSSPNAFVSDRNTLFAARRFGEGEIALVEAWKTIVADFQALVIELFPGKGK